MLELPARYIEFLSNAQLLRDLDSHSRNRFLSAVEPLSVSAGANLISQGEQIAHLFILCSGRLALTAEGREGETRFVSILEPGETVGGWMLCTDDDRSYADARALEPTDLVQMSREAFAEFRGRYPQQSAQILEKLFAHERRMRLLLALHSSQLFGDLDELALRELQAELEVITLRGGEILCRQGDPGDSLYLVVTGRLRVTVAKPDQGERVVGELGRGEIAGELAVISGEARSGTVYAIRDTQVAILSREAFQRLLHRHPDTVFGIVTKKLLRRLRHEARSGPVPESISTLAVIPASEDVDLEPLCTGLTKSLSQYGRACHLSSLRVDAQLGNTGLSQSGENSQQNLRLIEWLGKVETAHRFVLYQADRSPSEWTKRCLRQADRVLVVGQAAGSAVVGRIEEELLSQYHPVTSARRMLVLLHGEGGKEPSGTKAWLQGRKIERHYHVRPNRPEDIGRLARHVIGHATGLVLGGGFARGMVHIGVIGALRECGVPIDAIGGNSMGALLAAEYAVGWDLNRMLHDTARGCAACVKGMTLPLVAFKSGGDYSNLVCRFMRERQIEDLWLPYFCVSANLNRAELKIHTQGALAKAVLASGRVPGVFPPVVYDGEMHVDGGVLNNVPVDVMRGIIGSGAVIGVDAVPSRQFDLIEDYGLELNGFRTVLRRWNPFRRNHNQPVPHILQIMLRTIEFGGATFKRSNSQIADLYLVPPLREFKPTDFVNAEAIRDIGYQYTLQQAREWLSRRPHKTAGTPLVAHSISAT